MLTLVLTCFSATFTKKKKKSVSPLNWTKTTFFVFYVSNGLRTVLATLNLLVSSIIYISFVGIRRWRDAGFRKFDFSNFRAGSFQEFSAENFQERRKEVWGCHESWKNESWIYATKIKYTTHYTTTLRYFEQNRQRKNSSNQQKNKK